MSEAYPTPGSTQVAIACRPEYLDVGVAAGASNVQSSSAIIRTPSGKAACTLELKMSEVDSSVSRMLTNYRDFDVPLRNRGDLGR